MADQKTFLNIFHNLVGDIANANLLGDNMSTNGNVYINIEAKLNPNENITSKNNNNLCKENTMTNIEKLFQ